MADLGGIIAWRECGGGVQSGGGRRAVSFAHGLGKMAGVMESNHGGHAGGRVWYTMVFCPVGGKLCGIEGQRQGWWSGAVFAHGKNRSF